MASDKKLWEICMNIYREMYKAATPSANFDKLMKAGKTTKRDWFMKYYLSMEKQQAIVDKYVKRHKLNKHDAGKVSFTIFLGCAPTSATKEERKRK